MPRKPRFFVPDIPNHVIQRGNNREAVFFEDEDYQTYKNILHESAESNGVSIHAYVLMTNHIHILATANSTQGISLMMQKASRFYVPYINHKYGRTGTLWEGRFKSSLVDSEFYVLACMRYIEMNPVRAKMVDSPQDYQWSSYGINALGTLDRLVIPHASYLGLSRVKKHRRNKYVDLFSEHIDEKVLKAIRNCAQTGTPLGGSKFIKQIEDKLKVKVGYSKRGRPWNSG
ncbi:Transposase and inactivated derivatives [hydrothermal vent metagenome]|uniref:Transposase and inactivated derivatives n=1 Tax=hydrothermal vent metagenome TaxID=652676 RepID=A0A3B0W9W8_9ZZZZ